MLKEFRQGFERASNESSNPVSNPALGSTLTSSLWHLGGVESGSLDTNLRTATTYERGENNTSESPPPPPETELKAQAPPLKAFKGKAVVGLPEGVSNKKQAVSTQVSPGSGSSGPGPQVRVAGSPGCRVPSSWAHS